MPVLVWWESRREDGMDAKRLDGTGVGLPEIERVRFVFQVQGGGLAGGIRLDLCTIGSLPRRHADGSMVSSLNPRHVSTNHTFIHLARSSSATRSTAALASPPFATLKVSSTSVSPRRSPLFGLAWKTRRNRTVEKVV